MAKAPCSPATLLPSCRIDVTSAFCGVIPISFRSEPRRSAASSKGSNLSHSSRFMAAGGRRTFSQMQKQPLRDPPNAICAGSARRTNFNLAAFVSGEHRPLACSIRQLAECMLATAILLAAQFAASCRELQAGSVCSPDSSVTNSRSNHPQCAARRSQPARALTALRIVRAAFPQDSLQ